MHRILNTWDSGGIGHIDLTDGQIFVAMVFLSKLLNLYNLCIFIHLKYAQFSQNETKMKNGPASFIQRFPLL